MTHHARLCCPAKLAECHLHVSHLFRHKIARKDISSDVSLQQGRNRSRELNFSPYKPILAVPGMAHFLPSFLPAVVCKRVNGLCGSDQGTLVGIYN